MFWRSLGPAHMRSINHLYNACHIKKLLYDCGPQSVSAVLKLAWSQDNHPGSSSHHHQSIYGGHTCLLVRVWMWVRGWQLHSFMDLTCTGWGDAKDTFGERPVTFRKSDRPTKQHGIVVREVLVAKLGWSPVTDHRVQTPPHILLCHGSTRESGEPQASFSWCVLERLHMLDELLEPVFQKHRLTNCS